MGPVASLKASVINLH